MPFRSIKQRLYMMLNVPEVYEEWKTKYGTKIVSTKKQKRSK
jgi:hypothetical protein